MHISGQKKSHLKSGIRMKRNEIDESLRSLTIGFGFALCYTPALAMVGKYFSERKALAYGIAQSGTSKSTQLSFFTLFLSFVFSLFRQSTPASALSKFDVLPCEIHIFPSFAGSGIGTFILAPSVQLLIEYYSWRGAMLVLGAFVSNLCVCGALMRPRQPRGGVR